MRRLGLRNLEVSEGWATAVLPQDSELQFFSEAVCGQAIMAAIDTVAVLAMVTTDRPSQGTASQNTHLLRPATGHDYGSRQPFCVSAGTIGYAETRVTFEDCDELVAHATSEFIF